MTQEIAISKTGVNVLTATDPNDFIFHSLYNTFKIVAEVTTTINVGSGALGTVTTAHNLSYAPACTVFANKNGSNNVYGYGTFTPIGGDEYYLDLLYTDSTNASVVIKNASGSGSDFTVKFYLFEASV